MVSHQTDSLVRVCSQYKNTNRYLRGGDREQTAKKNGSPKGPHAFTFGQDTTCTQVLTDSSG